MKTVKQKINEFLAKGGEIIICDDNGELDLLPENIYKLIRTEDGTKGQAELIRNIEATHPSLSSLKFLLMKED